MFFQERLIFASDGESNYRIPSLVVTDKGTVLAFCNDRIGTLKDYADEVALVCATKKAGEEWSGVRVLAHRPGWACTIGSAVYDPHTARVLLSFGRSPVAKNEFGNYTKAELAEMERRREEAIRAAEHDGIVAGVRQLASDDEGAHFTEEAHVLTPAMQTHIDGKAYPVFGATHGGAHGICLRHGAHKGRLLCPSRTKIGEYSDWERIRECVYNNAIYSDDHGKAWQASSCVQVGTGEGTLIERADGSILYNSRAYFRDGKRYLAVSRDGGATYGEFSADDFLREETRMGCNASFLRVELEDIKDRALLPENAEDVTLFCNPRAETRRRMTVCVSFDGGAHFREARVIHDGPAAYSSLDYDKASGHFFLLYEKGEDALGKSPYAKGICVAEFDPEWLLRADETGGSVC